MGAYATGRYGFYLRHACNQRRLRPDTNAGQGRQSPTWTVEVHILQCGWPTQE